MPYVAYDFKPSPNLTNTISWVLSISGSSAQGLMSLGGTLAIWPTSIIWGLCAFGLTVAYEGEVNEQNARGAIEKLTDPHYAKTQLMKKYLREKFATFDQDRARFTTSKTLTTDEKKKVCLLHEVVIIKQDPGYKIGFCGKDGKYCEKDIQNYGAFLDDFQDDVFFEDDNHIIQLNDILKKFNPISAINATQKNYPLYAKQYIAQLVYRYQLELQRHEQRPDNEDGQALQAMSVHLEAFEDLIFNHLFSRIDIPVPENEKILSLPTDPNYPDFKEQYTYRFADATLHKKPNPDYCEIASEDKVQLSVEISNQIKEAFYTYHQSQLLIAWVQNDREEWQSKLRWHQFYLYVAGLFSICSGLIIAWGNSYLYLEMFAIIPYFALIPASVLPCIIVPLAIFSGLAQFTIMYNSLADMLTENPFQKFWEKINAAHRTTATKCFLVAFILLFTLATLVTFCSAGTWITVFGQTLPLFSWMNIMPVIALKFILPLFIGLSDLPFSFQSIASTLENLENNPTVIFLSRFISALCNGLIHLPHTREAWGSILYTLGLAALGLSSEAFEKETFAQKCNPFRLIIRLLYEPLRILLFLLHLFCEGEMFDRIEAVPVFLSVVSSMVLNLVQDLDYFFGHSHIDSTDTSAILKKHLVNAANDDHHNNLPEQILRAPFIPFFWAAYHWSYYFRPESDNSPIEAHKDTIEGFKPSNKKALDDIPDYRKTSDHKLFLFQAAQSKFSRLLNSDPCGTCIKKPYSIALS